MKLESPRELPSVSPATPPRRRLLEHPIVRWYLPRVREDLTATYARHLHKWLLIAPLVGIVTGLTITAVATVILRQMWPPILAYYLGHHWAIVPGLVLGCALTGLIMQQLTPNPNQHSTEEVIQAYHEHEGAIDMRAFPAKLLAAITTVGCGGSAALEGPSIYGGAAIGSWLWSRLQICSGLRLDARDRRIMLICGAPAGMSAVFRAPLTGIVFALEMPYKDDLAHEALLPSLLASVVSYMTLSSFLGSEPLFNFHSVSGYTMRDLLWSALLGALIGLLAMAFVITFRRLRTSIVAWTAPHWIKLTLGGLLTGLCGLAFIHIYPGVLIPLGANYEAVGQILNQSHSSQELVVFAAFKLAATAFTSARAASAPCSCRSSSPAARSAPPSRSPSCTARHLVCTPPSAWRPSSPPPTKPHSPPSSSSPRPQAVTPSSSPPLSVPRSPTPSRATHLSPGTSACTSAQT